MYIHVYKQTHTEEEKPLIVPTMERMMIIIIALCSNPNHSSGINAIKYIVCCARRNWTISSKAMIIRSSTMRKRKRDNQPNCRT